MAGIVVRVITTIITVLGITQANFDVSDYLSRYGYMDDPSTIGRGGAAKMIDPAAGLLEFQKAYGLPRSGQLDDRTLNFMRTPRCGVADRTKHSRGRRSLTGQQLLSKWPKTKLAYFIASHPPYMDGRVVETVIWNAFAKWQEVSPFDFSRARDAKSADIVLSFADVNHDCTSRFREGDLAHAFFPTTGKLHYNLRYRWDKDNMLSPVSIHEIGHTLGLTHSTDAKSVMFAYNTPDMKTITTAEISELRQAYGLRDGEKWVEEDVIVHADEHPDVCLSPVDAAFRRRGEYVMFRGSWVWRFTRDTKQVIGPVAVKHYYQKVERVDAALEILDDVYLFSGTDVFVEERGRMREPVRLRNIGITRTDRIKLAFAWNAVNYDSHPGMYVFGDDENYWRIDPHHKMVADGYPRLISNNWAAVPKAATAAFEYGEKNDLVFIAGDIGYLTNISDSGSLTIEQGYPRPLWTFFEYCRAKHNKFHAHQHNARVRTSSATIPHGVIASLIVTLVTWYL